MYIFKLGGHQGTYCCIDKKTISSPLCNC